MTLAPLEMAFSYSEVIASLAAVSRIVDVLFILDMMITFNVATSSHGRLRRAGMR